MDRDPGDQQRASLRASDADREQFVEALRQHHAEGRLTLEELTERTERAYAARTLGDLDALGGDLPPLLWYGMLTLVVLVVWVMSGAGYFWPIWPILGFAMLLGWQAFNVLGPRPEDRGRRRDR
jgi:Domain of unknown function (DUF1707)